MKLCGIGASVCSLLTKGCSLCSPTTATWVSTSHGARLSVMGPPCKGNHHEDVHECDGCWSCICPTREPYAKSAFWHALSIVPRMQIPFMTCLCCALSTRYIQIDLRLVLLCLVVLSNHGFFIVEQPRQSLFFDHFRWGWLENKVCWEA